MSTDITSITKAKILKALDEVVFIDLAPKDVKVNYTHKFPTKNDVDPLAKLKDLKV